MLRLLPAIAALLAGCEPTCNQACKKALECEEVETPRLGLEDCEVACLNQEELYEQWDDGIKREAHAESKRCIVQEECDAIAEGVCYDDDLFIW